MWSKIKEVARSLFGSQDMTFSESPSVLIGETAYPQGFTDPAIFECFDIIIESVPKGCAFSIYLRGPKIIFIAAVSRETCREIEGQRGLRIAA